MKYTVTELCDILGVTQSLINGWIKEGITSSHSNWKGEKIYLKAEKIEGRGKGGHYYLIDANDVNDFMCELYHNSYFFKWFRK